ncbi:MAG TPA: hypothetical protein VFQ85_06130 [Mycobacteriales bacterium]|nr:hypothetical protein [Mycobacteriales bacterium]
MRRSVLLLSLLLALPLPHANATPVCASVHTDGSALTDETTGACVPYDHGVYCETVWESAGTAATVVASACVPTVV